ncbi:MAG: phosphotriesterase, partial [Pseudoflavonifractor sp.]
DAQPVAAGRDAAVLRQLSQESGIVLVASTGYHLLGFYAENCWVHGLDEEGLYALYRSEAEQGMLPYDPDPARRPIGRTQIRAGMVKAAIPREGAAGRYEVLLRAAARAAADTGTPLMLHTERGENALGAIRLCQVLGVRPEKLVVCHADRQAEQFAPHEALAATGVYLDYDTIGRFRYHSDEAEIALLRHMTQLGYGAQILLALDTTAARLGAYGGELSLRYLLDDFLPRLRREGFDPTALDLFTRDNCRQLFAD